MSHIVSKTLARLDTRGQILAANEGTRWRFSCYTAAIVCNLHKGERVEKQKPF